MQATVAQLTALLLAGALFGGLAGALVGRWLTERERGRWGVTHGL